MKTQLLIASMAWMMLAFTPVALAEICDMPDHMAGMKHEDCPHRGMEPPRDQHAMPMRHEHAAADDIYAPAMDKMMRDMPDPTGNADADFMRGMMVHHQAAVEMANTALKQAQDPQVRALAQTIITAQKSEIAYMHGWLLQHGYPQP